MDGAFARQMKRGVFEVFAEVKKRPALTPAYFSLIFTKDAQISPKQ
jgi:hypothetical protein